MCLLQRFLVPYLLSFLSDKVHGRVAFKSLGAQQANSRWHRHHTKSRPGSGRAGFVHRNGRRVISEHCRLLTSHYKFSLVPTLRREQRSCQSWMGRPRLELIAAHRDQAVFLVGNGMGGGLVTQHQICDVPRTGAGPMEYGSIEVHLLLSARSLPGTVWAR
jgi:hypothetical protein